MSGRLQGGRIERDDGSGRAERWILEKCEWEERYERKAIQGRKVIR